MQIEIDEDDFHAVMVSLGVRRVVIEHRLARPEQLDPVIRERLEKAVELVVKAEKNLRVQEVKAAAEAWTEELPEGEMHPVLRATLDRSRQLALNGPSVQK